MNKVLSEWAYYSPSEEEYEFHQLEENDEGYFEKYKDTFVYKWLETKGKPLLCGNNPVGDFFYKMSSDLDCTCCAFVRGAALSAILFFVLGAIVF